MKRLLVNDLGELACIMHDVIVDEGIECATFVGRYEDVVYIIKELLMFDEVFPYQIDLESVDWGEYDKEYYITLDNELNIWCSKVYDIEDDIITCISTDIAFIADDCNSAILKGIGCDKNGMYEVSYYLDDEEPNCDGNCECCNLTEKDNSDDDHEVVTRVVVDDTGKLRGFEKSWSTKKDNMTYHSTYTHYSNNTELLKQLMEDFDIKF